MNIDYKIMPFNGKDGRFIIQAGTLRDDANGYGYSSIRNAEKAAWYKFKGGKQKIAETNSKGKKFCDDLKKSTGKCLYNLYDNFMDSYFKEIYRGESTEDELWEEIEMEISLKIPIFVRSYIKNS